MEKKFKSDYYAQALFNIARANDSIDRVEEELSLLKDTVVSNLDFKKFLTDPTIKNHEKIGSLFEILGDDASQSIKAIASMLLVLDGVEDVEKIYSSFVEITNNYKKQVSIDVVSAIALDKKMLDEIKRDVDKKTGLDVRVKNTVDTEIIGGLVIRIGDRVIDLSIKNKIEDIKSKLKALELRGEDFGIEN
ncbi:MAG: ATP synthase F1 subunit delta [Actinobacteria bacterium]|nr:ATP synthase F1 subunit delta [Actinomycetota bacterium]